MNKHTTSPCAQVPTIPCVQVPDTFSLPTVPLSQCAQVPTLPTTSQATTSPRVQVPTDNNPIIYSDENTIPMPNQQKISAPPEWKKCMQSYIRDFMVENSNLKRERIERPNVPPMRLAAFDGCAAILRRRVKLNKQGYPIMRLYKCVDTESEQEMFDSNVLPQQVDDQMKCVITCTDLTLDKTMSEQYANDDSRFNVFIVDVQHLLEDGWTPMYDRGYIYWYPPVTEQYLYGGPEFSSDHLSDPCIDY
jgi:hypothetical protein